jgi:hypothetical protein
MRVRMTKKRIAMMRLLCRKDLLRVQRTTRMIRTIYHYQKVHLRRKRSLPLHYLPDLPPTTFRRSIYAVPTPANGYAYGRWRYVVPSAFYTVWSKLSAADEASYTT